MFVCLKCLFILKNNEELPVRGDQLAYSLFMQDLKERLASRVQLTTDDFKPYIRAADDTFGADVDYAQLAKIYGQPKASAANARNWYEPVRVTGAIPITVIGRPKAMHISYFPR